jgi:hypothetical protein
MVFNGEPERGGDRQDTQFAVGGHHQIGNANLHNHRNTAH